jgi:hypothetical protein
MTQIEEMRRGEDHQPTVVVCIEDVNMENSKPREEEDGGQISNVLSTLMIIH